MRRISPYVQDPDELHTALSNLVKLYQFRDRDEYLFYGVTVTQSYCIRALWKNGPMSMSALAEEVSVSVSTMTGVIDQLVQKAMVRRVSDAKDRRVQRVELTAEGKAIYERTNEQFQAHLERAMKGRSQRERRVIIAFLHELADVIRDWRKVRA